MKSSDGKPIRNFKLAGVDGHYFPAIAEIHKNKVVLNSKKAPMPLTVRYVWKPTPQKVNLFNSDDLPAKPFRTDSQPLPQK